MSQLGKYEIIEKIGRGGFGVVYKARDRSLDRLVALKVLHPQLTVEPDFIEKFRKEAQVQARISHNNVVTIYEINEFEGRIYIAMAYMAGGSLAKRIADGPISLDEAVKITDDAGKGLQAGHEKGLIHRDVKPGNILFNESGEVVIADFGLAKAVELSSSTAFSSYGGAVGTPNYRAPELWTGTEPPTPATDVYSLACVFFEMLTGEVLFDGDTPPMVMKKHFDPIDLKGTLPQSVPSEYEMMLTRALSINNEDRFPSINAFLYLLKIHSDHDTSKKSAYSGGSKSDEHKKRTLTASEISERTNFAKRRPEKVETAKKDLQKKEKLPEKKSGKGRPRPIFALITIALIFVLGLCVFLYLMPASWWCAITFNAMEGCPMP